ncbi:zinc finger BED domain-containing protein RICESLEEPER 2-like [Fagus crenata]
MLKAECLKIFKEERVKIKQVLADLDGQIGLSYLCAAHFIDDGWEVKKWVLSLCHVWEEEDDVSKVLLKCLSDWNIETKISMITMKMDSLAEIQEIIGEARDLVPCGRPTSFCDGKLQVTAVLDAIQTLYDEYATTIDESEKSMSKSSASFEGGNGAGPCPKFKRVEEGCDKLDLYFEDPVIPWIEEFDIIRWWRASSSKYPTPARVARDLLAIPISVVTHMMRSYNSKEIDSCLISSGRDMMGALMCTRSW